MYKSALLAGKQSLQHRPLAVLSPNDHNTKKDSENFKVLYETIY
jgi:hypothetical protein